MWPHDPGLRTALMGDHEMVVQVDVFNDDGLRAANVPIEDGTITASLLSDVCRSGNLAVSQRLIEDGLFDPDWDHVRVLTGPRGWPLVPIFTGRVQDLSEADSGAVQVSLADYGQDLVDAAFERPWTATAGNPVATEMLGIITNVDLSFGLDRSLAPVGAAPAVTWEESRGEALDQLAASINCIWQSDRSGSFVLYPNPYQSESLPQVMMMLSDGPGGTLTSVVKTSTRDKVYNSITVIAERAENAPPVRVTVRDNTAGSKTQWGGKFGKSNRVIRLQTANNDEDARSVAQRILNQSLALGRSWRFSTPHFPLLDPGDVIGMNWRGEVSVQVIESITYPLSALNATSVSTRELRYQSEDAQ